MEQWDKAAHQIDALPVAEQSRAEVRYVRARAAIALGDHAKALVVLDKLEKRLPLLREDIALRRAEAHLHAGSPEAAAQIFEANPSMRTLIKAALAWERAGQLQQGRKAINRAIHLARARDRTALEAMLVRARIAEAQGDANAAIADLRAVAARADDADLLRQAAAKLDQLDAKHHLTSQEHLDRADRIAQRGDTADALEALAQAEEAPGPPVTQARMLHARASARYKGRQNYDQAADLYEKAARIPGAHVPECLYFAAKAWTRADRNDRGLALYDELVRRFPRSLWAEAAMFYAARVHRFSARWATAAAAYSNYLKRYRQGAFRHDARYERSLCLLLAGQHRDARRSLTELAGSERNRLDARSMKYLAATAAFQDGDKHAAILAWREAARDEPLSWFALASTAQMRAAAVATPAAVPPASAAGSAAPLSVRLPPTAGLLRDIGLDDDAEEYLLEHEDALVKPFGTRNAQARCALYQTLGTAKRLHQVAQRYAPVQLVYAAPSRSTRW
ncbi:MAG: hypothetical protein MUF54_07555, partial [Polyangiaceae bacterium]|nr:hypothetical protein [Polyangiaceae bacterium]